MRAKQQARARHWQKCANGSEAAGLTLHPTKTRIVDASQRGGFDFLGYHFERGYRWPRQKSLDKFKEAIRAKDAENPIRPDEANRRGNQPDSAGLVWTTSNTASATSSRRLDQWVRRTPAHHPAQAAQGTRDVPVDETIRRWPNAYFAELGLISLALARAKASQCSYMRPTDWRAGCGKTASPVRREGRGSIPRPYPYPLYGFGGAGFFCASLRARSRPTTSSFGR